MTESLEDFHPYDKIGTFQCYAAFTEDKYIKQYDPRGCSVVEQYVHEFIPLLLEKNPGSLIINPKGDLRGELYRNELQSIASALSKSRN